MKIHVGQVLTFGGKNWLITHLVKLEETCLFPLSGAKLLEERRQIQNAKHLNLEIEPFEANQIVDFEIEYAELRLPGQDCYFIYTKYKATAHKESTNAIGTSSSTLETTSREAQGPQ